ncbi:hypothetical protein [Flavobacterium sp. UMI-01]|uniref:hypothetical protein n=1 Tax=Flavobacterium sp. UMI-01 TaxID=1441053 RepID=UPI001C7D1A4A|nr:hypothetical protein [Flavobacterium sp. UMI-01]GIZ08352.1 hypothetical protein FUMI01_10790 [Flavobacterium sp. UMI-01]
MKAILLYLFPVLLTAQGLEVKKSEDFTLSVITDPRASFKESGLFIGAEIEYSGTIYTRLGISNFSVLQDGYTEAIGGIGLNLTSGYFDNIRYYAGVRLGVIKRAMTNATAGVEAGIDFKISDKAFIGLRTSYDYRSDQKFYDYPNHMVGSGYIRIGTNF